MEVNLSSIDASYLVWDNIWKRGAPNPVELNILDVVLLSQEGTITGWLFTSSAGVVKNKLVANWKPDAILNRCLYFENDIMIHHYNSNVKKWNVLVHADQLLQSFSTKGPSKAALVLHPILNKSSTFMEVSCVKLQKDGRIEVPSYFNSWLCDLSAKSGHARSLPTESITSKDKESNRLSRDYTATIVKILESNLRIKVTHISIVVVFETIGSRAGAASSSGMGLSTNLSSESRIVRLHHVRRITYCPVSVHSGFLPAGNDSFSEVNSSIADQSLGFGSVLPAKPSRVDCCHGDFCQYAMGDGSDTAVSTAASSSTAVGGDLDEDFLGEEGGFSVQSEARKAVNRHRPSKKGEQGGSQDREDGDDDTAEKMDLYPGQTDHLISAAQASMRDATINSSSNLLQRGMNSSESLHTKQPSVSLSSIQTLKSKLLGEKVKRTEKKLQVMAKSIALARQEMAEIEQQDLDYLNDSTGGAQGNDNKSRGREGSPRRRGMPSTAAIKAASKKGEAVKVWPYSLSKWWLSTGRNLPKNSLSVMVPSSSAHCISQTVLAAKSVSAAPPDESADDFNSTRRRSTKAPTAVLPPLEDVEQANSLYFSWYYNPVRVCERCHKIYTELDRQRKMRFKHLMKKQKEQLDKVDNDPQRWREVEQRIFKQRQFVSRLAKADTASTASYRASMEALPGSHNLAFDSMADDPLKSGVAFGRAFRHSEADPSYAARSTPQAPTHALPPKPWNLNQEGQSEAYADASNSILTRRILKREPDLSSLNRGSVGSMSQSDQILQQQWSDLTGPRRVNEHSNRAAKKNPKLSKLPGRPAAKFDADRLLHPWQRQMNAMKQKIREQERQEKKSGAYGYEGYEDEEGEEGEGGADLGERVPTAQYSMDDLADMYGERVSHSADYESVATDQATLGGSERLHVQSAGSNNIPSRNYNNHARSAGSLPVPKGGLQKLKSIDAAWGSEGSDRGSTTNTPTFSQTSANSLGSPLAADKYSTAAASIDRVGNALIGGLSSSQSNNSVNSKINAGNRINTIPEQEDSKFGTNTDNTTKPPTHNKTAAPTAAAFANDSGDGDDDYDDGGEDEEDDDDEEIGWSPFAVR